jgi:hypothetical protein
MKRTVYEAPITECFHVEMEGAFCSASIVNGNNGEVQTTGHEINEIDLSDTDKHTWNDYGGWE